MVTKDPDYRRIHCEYFWTESALALCGLFATSSF